MTKTQRMGPPWYMTWRADPVRGRVMARLNPAPYGARLASKLLDQLDLVRIRHDDLRPAVEHRQRADDADRLALEVRARRRDPRLRQAGLRLLVQHHCEVVVGAELSRRIEEDQIPLLRLAGRGNLHLQRH